MMMVLLALLATLAAQQAQAGQCVKESFEGAGYIVCTIDPAASDLRLFWKDADGRPFRTFSRLADAIDGILHRVLDGEDVAGLVVEGAQAGIERGRLAGACRAGDEDDAIGLVQRAAIAGRDTRRHAQRINRHQRAIFLQKAHHHAFAMARWQGRDAHINTPPGKGERDPAILRYAPLGNVEPGHHLQAGDERRRQMRRQADAFFQYAIKAEADRYAVLKRLDMDVGRPCPYGIGHKAVDEADDRRLGIGCQQVFSLRHVLDQPGEAVALPGFLARGANRIGGVDFRQGPVKGSIGERTHRRHDPRRPHRFAKGQHIRVLTHQESRRLAGLEGDAGLACKGVCEKARCHACPY